VNIRKNMDMKLVCALAFFSLVPFRNLWSLMKISYQWRDASGRVGAVYPKIPKRLERRSIRICLSESIQMEQFTSSLIALTSARDALLLRAARSCRRLDRRCVTVSRTPIDRARSEFL
jgi:hypothetical protein